MNQLQQRALAARTTLQTVRAQEIADQYQRRAKQVILWRDASPAFALGEHLVAFRQRDMWLTVADCFARAYERLSDVSIS